MGSDDRSWKSSIRYKVPCKFKTTKVTVNPATLRPIYDSIMDVSGARHTDTAWANTCWAAAKRKRRVQEK